MRQEVYTVNVTEREQLAGWNHADLGEDGDFFAETVQIDVGDMSDHDDIIIGTAADTITNFQPGASWKFKAYIFDSDVGSVDFLGFDGW